MNGSKKVMRLKNTTELRDVIEKSPTASKLLSDVEGVLQDLGSDDKNLAVITTFVIIALQSKNK